MGSRKRWSLTVLSAVAVAAASLITAPTAAAAPSPNPIYVVPDTGSGCTGADGTQRGTVRDQASGGSLVTTVDASAGRVLSVVNNCPVVLVARVEDAVGGLLALPSFPSGATTEVNVTGAAAIDFYRENPSNAYRYVAGGVSIINSEAPATGNTPPPVLQQFGRPGVVTCDEAAPEDLNWGGASSGGWGDSWAQWMNGGLGGAVCTRMLVYRNAQGRWIVAE